MREWEQRESEDIMPTPRFVLLGIIILLLTAGVALAANADYNTACSVVAVGGGARVSGSFSTWDCIGEGAAGLSQSQHYLLRAGYAGGMARQPAPAPPLVPSVSHWGMVAMMALLAGLLARAATRRRPPTPAEAQRR